MRRGPRRARSWVCGIADSRSRACSSTPESFLTEHGHIVGSIQSTPPGRPLNNVTFPSWTPTKNVERPYHVIAAIAIPKMPSTATRT